jgi:hypothetical protein
MRKRKLVAAIAGACAALLVAGIAVAANEPGGSPQPANKAVAAGDKTVVFTPDNDQTLLTASIKTSKPTDLLLQTTLECSILTKLTTGPTEQSPASSTASVRGYVRGWIEIDDDPDARETEEVGADPVVVPIESSSQPPQGPAEPGEVDHTDSRELDESDDAVTFCDRTYQRTVEDAEDDDDGIDRQTDYINTKAAHGFNWVLLNAGSGVHYVRLMSDLFATNPAGGDAAARCNLDTTTSHTTCSEAYVGNRTMIIEPTKMANDAVISNPGS